MDRRNCFVRSVRPTFSSLVTIEFDGVALSITGEIRGGGCGQVCKELRNIAEQNKKLFLNRDVVFKLCDIWERWHLNDLRAGTPAQEEAVRSYRQQMGRPCNYDEVCDYLKSIGLYEDDGYRYGSEWLIELVPDEVIRWLFNLPGNGDTAEDIYPVEIDEQSFVSMLLCRQMQGLRMGS